ncbi:hypothetical protein GCM10027568_28520 [Humibacter soli]
MSGPETGAAWVYPARSGYPDGAEQRDDGRRDLVDQIAARHSAPGSSNRSDYELGFSRDDENLKYEVELNQDTIGALSYKTLQNDTRVALLSTAVKFAYRNHGVATELIARALDDIRPSGRTITIICPIIREFIDRNPEYEDLVDKVHPGIRSTAQALQAASVDDVDDVLTAFESGVDSHKYGE